MIKKLDFEDILPAEGVGKIKLGMSYDEVIDILKNYYRVSHEKRNYKNHFALYIGKDDIEIVFSKIKIVDAKSIPLLDEDIVVSRISVGNDFKGKLFGKIGIGNTLKDVSRDIGEWFDDDYDDGYELKDYPGVAFFLKDIGKDSDEDVWDDWTYPIESISIYPKDFHKGWFDVVVVREGKKNK